MHHITFCRLKLADHYHSFSCMLIKNNLFLFLKYRFAIDFQLLPQNNRHVPEWIFNALERFKKVSNKVFDTKFRRKECNGFGLNLIKLYTKVASSKQLKWVL